MPRSQSILLPFTIVAVLALRTEPAHALSGPLKSPAGIAFSSTYPDEARAQVIEALQQEGAEFVDGSFVNAISTLNYRGETKALNALANRLAHCPGTMVFVSFQKFAPEHDWRVVHDAHLNHLQVIVNLNSQRIDLVALAIPPAQGPALQEK